MWVPVQLTDAPTSRGVMFYRKECHILLLGVPTHISGPIWTRERNVNRSHQLTESIKRPPSTSQNWKVTWPPPSAAESSSPFFQRANYSTRKLKRTLGIRFGCLSSPHPLQKTILFSRAVADSLSYTHSQSSEVAFHFIGYCYFPIYLKHLEGEKCISNISPSNAGSLQK